MNQDRTPLLTLEHPHLGGYEARVGRDFYGPVPGCDWLEVWDDEGDLVLSVVNRLDPPDERVEAIRLLLLKHGYLQEGDDRLHTLLG